MKLTICPQCNHGNRSERYWCQQCIEREGWEAYARWLEAELTQRAQSEAMLKEIANAEIERIEESTLSIIQAFQMEFGRVPPQ